MVHLWAERSSHCKRDMSWPQRVTLTSNRIRRWGIRVLLGMLALDVSTTAVAYTALFMSRRLQSSDRWFLRISFIESWCWDCTLNLWVLIRLRSLEPQRWELSSLLLIKLLWFKYYKNMAKFYSLQAISLYIRKNLWAALNIANFAIFL